MKRILALFLVLAFTLSLAGCSMMGSGNNGDRMNGTQSGENQNGMADNERGNGPASGPENGGANGGSGDNSYSTPDNNFPA
ncbi:MAG: hypothetical protein IKK71_03370 [Clostridia bacterium]|nr:hypothetical protein [Clostridia bacterium]